MANLPSLAFPLAGLALVALPVLYGLHRRSRPEGEHPLTTFYLLPRSLLDGRRGARLRSPIVLALRVLLVLALVAIAAAPTDPGGGTLVIAEGPFTVDPKWSSPLTIVRAGRPPTVVTEVLPVAITPDLHGALALGLSRVPGASPVFPRSGHRAPLALAVGAVTEGQSVRVTVQRGEGPIKESAPLILVDSRGKTHAFGSGLRPTIPTTLPSGVAKVRVVGALPDPALEVAVCVPDASKLRISDERWPDSFERLFRLLDTVRRVPVAEADWRLTDLDPLAIITTADPGLLGFGTRFAFASNAQGRLTSGAPLYALDDRPSPMATADRIVGLAPGARADLWADDEIVVDSGASLAGPVRRWGLPLDETDFDEGPAFPVFVSEAIDADRASRAPCRTVNAGETLEVLTPSTLSLTDPLGSTRTFSPDSRGIVRVDGLDAVGVYELDAGGRGLSVVVREPLEPPSRFEVSAPAPAGGQLAPAPAGGRAILAVVLAVLVLLASRRWSSPWAIATVLTSLLVVVNPDFGLGERGRVAVAVDTSRSMPRTATLALVDRLLAALPTEDVLVVFGDDQVRGVGSTIAQAEFERGTLAGPLLAAARVVSGAAGSIVYVTDGRARDLPLVSDVPIFPAPVIVPGTDVSVLSAQARRWGDTVFIQALLQAGGSGDPTADVTAEIEVGRITVERNLDRSAPTPFRARLALSGRTALTIKATSPDDPFVENDVLRVPIEDDSGTRLSIVSPTADGRARALRWARAGGLHSDPPAEGQANVTALVGPADLRLEDRPTVVWMHDTPAETLSPELRRELTGWVRGGGLLLLSGRARAFGRGGFAGTELDALSPLKSDVRPKGSGRVCVVLLVDRSGSMAVEAGGIGAAALGRLASSLVSGLRSEGLPDDELSSEGLPDDDELAVVAFGVAAETLSPRASVSELKRRGLPLMSTTEGGTLLQPALDAATRILAGSQAETRLVLLVGDGQFADADAVRHVAGLRSVGARLIGVLVGDEATAEPLLSLARSTGGDVSIVTAAEAPSLALTRVLDAVGDGLEGGGGEVEAGPFWTARIGTRTPTVAARIRVTADPAARVLARVEGEPLLAEWLVGAGRVIALATDDFELPDAGFAALLSPARGAAANDPALRVDASLRRVVLSYATGSAPGEDPVAPACFSSGDMTPLCRPFRLSKPGEFEAPIPALPEGPARVSVDLTTGRRLAVFSSGVPDELRVMGPDLPALDALAVSTGGAVIDTAPPDRQREDVHLVSASLGRLKGRTAFVFFALLTVLLAVVEAAGWAGVGAGLTLGALLRAKRASG